MSQQQQRPQPGDVFPVSGDQVARCEREDLLGSRDSGRDCLSVAKTDLPGKRVITASAGGQVSMQLTDLTNIAPSSLISIPSFLLQVIAQFAVPTPESEEADLPGDAVTIGEALEAAAGDKPVSRSNAAAIQVAEARATGLGSTMPGGVTAEAQAAAELNARSVRGEDKVKLHNILSDATVRLPKDKMVTREDAERVKAAEKRNDADEEGASVAAAMEAASSMNQPGKV